MKKKMSGENYIKIVYDAIPSVEELFPVTIEHIFSKR